MAPGSVDKKPALPNFGLLARLGPSWFLGGKPMSSAPPPTKPAPRRSLLRRLLRVLLVALLVVAVLSGAGALWVRSLLLGSLPKLSGEIEGSGVAAPVRIERDALGVPTIHAQTREDLLFALGFLHAQDRFFQMDLLRRVAAGEMAALLGPTVVGMDRKSRVHRFRDLARRAVTEMTVAERRGLDAYVHGVNAGLEALDARPFEYYLLGQRPEPWESADCFLVLCSMFLLLQGHEHVHESALGVLHDVMPPALCDFLAPLGTEWDAPLEGGPIPTPPIPGPATFDLRSSSVAPGSRVRQNAGERTPRSGEPGYHLRSWLERPGVARGSNNWALTGSRTHHGGAILADDMHLDIRVPNTWYRISLRCPAAADTPAIQATGVTLPGGPALVVGSNGHIAWGFTNSYGDFSDLVVLDLDPADANAYLTPQGKKRFEKHQEVIHVHGGPDEYLEVVSTIWGPVIDTDHHGRKRALRWVAHDIEGINLGLTRLPTAQTLEEALDLANRSGGPHQNFTVADDRGRIAWTIFGRLPRRVGHDGRLPASWADGSRRWDGYLRPEEYPRIVQPAEGRIWTANSRVVNGEKLAKIGFGGYDLGVRAGRIRDDLRALEKASEADMLAIQLDDRAVLLDRWRDLLLKVLSSTAISGQPGRAEFRLHVAGWDGHAGKDSVGYRLLVHFREHVTAAVLEPLTEGCRKADPRFTWQDLPQQEGPVWKLVSERPAHLLPPRYKSWDELLLDAVDEVVADLQKQGPALAERTWGEENTTDIRHPLSKALPLVGSWLDMPSEPLPGGWSDVPRIQYPDVGASERMVVSPGHEEEGYFHMPCGQSGHPLSPHYRDGHAAWSQGQKTPFLPGPTVQTLVLKP
jgi:penicillin amidase